MHEDKWDGEHMDGDHGNEFKDVCLCSSLLGAWGDEMENMDMVEGCT